MNEQKFDQIDDERIQKFETDWVQEAPSEIADYLPNKDDAAYLGTLEELVHIDLEFRWKDFAKQSTPEIRPKSVEEYIDLYPELESVKVGLIQGEFELANRFGGSPSVQNFVDRFGVSVSGSDLRPILQSVLSEIDQNRTIKPGTTIGRYEIVNEHGRGGFAAVWRATDSKLGRRIAVKQLGQRLARNAESRRRFISEAKVTARLEHPGIVPVYDISYDEDDYAYYTMRLINGLTMAEAIDELHQLDISSAEFELTRQRLLQSFVDVCQTIEYSHSKGVIHRDIKPQNIIVGNYGETIILDWGLASVIDLENDPTESILSPNDARLGSDDLRGNLRSEQSGDQQQDDSGIHHDSEILSAEESLETIRGVVMGTPAYMPPEQAHGDLQSISRRSDIYSLGATLYHLVSGEIPFTNGPIDELILRVKTGDLPSAREANPEVEKPLSSVVSKAMSLKPEQRYNSTRELLDDVQKFLADQSVSAFEDSILARSARWVRKNQTKAAIFGLTLLFFVVAAVAGIFVNNAWEAREDRRITELQIAAERADAAAISQIQSGRFESATKMLAQARRLIQNEEKLAPLDAEMAAREDRTQRIVKFSTLSAQAQEETFFDRIDRSAIYCQAALNELGVLDHGEWWTQLPDEDLSPAQSDELTTKVYRTLGLLASMRIAETAEKQFSFKLLTDPQQVDPDDPAAVSIRAAGFAAEQGNRFRKSRALQIIEEVGAVVSGEQSSIDTSDINPKNSTDSAIMGSILDNNIPAPGPEFTLLRGILGFRNPNVVAREWLDDSIRDDPNWFWLPVFKGFNQIKSGDYEEATKTLSHAVGVRPDYWVAYQFRAWASLLAAKNKEISRKQRTVLLNSASRDIQRAMDLEQNKSELFWIQATILSQKKDIRETQVTQTFLRAMELHRMSDPLGKGHYSAITTMFFERAQAWSQFLKNDNKFSPELFEVLTATLLWQREFEKALESCAEGLEKYPEAKQLMALQALIQMERNPESSEFEAIQLDDVDRFGWQVSIANARLARNQDDNSQEKLHLDRALEFARANWQKSKTSILLARNFIGNGRHEEALQQIANAIAIDRAVDLSQIKIAAQANLATPIIEYCATYALENEPKRRLQQPNRTIQTPALLNGGFELGLSYYWTPYAQRNESATWNNLGNSRSTAELSDNQARSGSRSLRILIDAPVDPVSFGKMSQAIPLTKGAKYRLSFWAKGSRLSNDAVQVGVIEPGLLELGKQGRMQFVSVSAGNFDWQQFEVEFDAFDHEVPISIRAQGSGEVWIDDMEIEIVDN